jgi:TolB-like protein/Tfp pilus assembly protein PilF
VTTSPDIFLSYTREDQATAQRFAEAFEGQGFSVWWDATLRSGEAYDQVTEEALRTAKAVVVLWSKKSVVSRWVRAEATLADRNRTLVPAMIEPCERPIMFELTQTADLSQWTGATDDRAWRAFLTDVQRFVEASAARRPPAETPREEAALQPPPRGARPSLAVLPFINRSGVKSDDIFANGMVYDLVAALSTSRRMKVVAASATAAYRKEARDLRQIGRDLGVRYLLEGNLRRMGDQLRVTAQLVEAETDNILWTQKFDRPIAELAALQEDLAADVAAHLGVQVQRAEVEHALKKPGKITAWEAVLRSDAHLFRSTRTGCQAAVAEARRAVELDPDWGTAYAVLAAAQALLWRRCDDPDLEQQALDNIERARAFDPSNPLVLCRIAGAYRALGKPREALPFDQRAVELNPNIEIVHQSLASNLLVLGRPEEALVELDAVERLAPQGPWLAGNLCLRSVGYLLTGRLDQARETIERSVRLQAQPTALLQLAICLALTNDFDRARDNLRRLRSSDPEMSSARAENLLRFLYGESDAGEYIGLVRRLWDEAQGKTA